MIYRRVALLLLYLFMLTGVFVLSMNSAGAETDSPGQWLHIIKSPDTIFVQRGGRAQFTIVVLNTSNSFAMRDIVVSDLQVPDCSLPVGALAPAGEFSYNCVLNNVQNSFTNIAVVTGTNAVNGKTDTASDTASVELVELTLDVTGDPASLPEPGGPVTFTLGIRNSGSIAAQLTGLTSPRYGDLTSPTNPLLEANSCAGLQPLPALAPGDAPITCSYTARAAGAPGPFTETVVVSAVAGETFAFQDSGSGTVLITDSPSELQASLSAAADRAALGSTLTLNVNLLNASAVDSVTIVNMSDSEIGDVTPYGSCAVPLELGPGESYDCAYSQIVAGEPDRAVTYEFSASGINDDDPPQTATAQATKMIFVFEPIVFIPVVANPLNKSCSTAQLLETGVEYSFLPAMRDAWYYFNTALTADLLITMNDFVPVEGQMVLYANGNKGCGSLRFVANNGEFSETKLINVPQAPPDRYYLRIYTDGPLNNEIPYSLMIELR